MARASFEASLTVRAKGHHWRAPTLLLLAACKRDPAGVEEMVVDAPHAHWFTGEFASMVGPVRVPSPEQHRAQVEVWLGLPADAIVEAAPGRDGGSHLRFPAGTRADRIEWTGDGDARRIVDVRGTELLADGGCRHHVLRPQDEQPDGPLVGFQWPCDQPEAAAVATERMRARLATLPPFSRMRPEVSKRALDGFVQRNDCDGCHQEGRADATRVDEHGPVWRGTDASGFFEPESVLRDAVPLEAYGAFDLNLADPAISVACPDGAPETIEPRHGVVRRRCADGQVPVASIDWPTAHREDPARVATICASRAYLWDHLDAGARALFPNAMGPC